MAVLSGVTNVDAAGTAKSLAAAGTRANCSVAIHALAGNTGVVYIGNDGAGDVASTNGFELSAGEMIILEYVGDLSTIKVDAANTNDKVSWLILKSIS